METDKKEEEERRRRNRQIRERRESERDKENDGIKSCLEYYAAIKNAELMSFVGTWMNLKTVILSKLTQEQKTKHYMFLLISGC